jgi:uncharacterized protein with PQ loop repeat
MSYSTAAYAILAGAVAVGLLMAYGDGKQSEITQIYADSLGLLSTVLSFVQFMPQIISTFRSRTVGALSMPSMMIQSPGSFLMAYLIAISEGTNVSTWSSYVASGSLQFILLCIAATWHFRDRWRADSEVSSNSNGESDDYDEGFVDEKQPFIPKEESVEIDNNKSVDNAVVAHSSQSLPLNTAAPVRIPERKRQHYSLTPASLGQFVGKNLKSTAGGGGRVNRSHQ